MTHQSCFEKASAPSSFPLHGLEQEDYSTVLQEPDSAVVKQTQQMAQLLKQQSLQIQAQQVLSTQLLFSRSVEHDTNTAPMYQWLHAADT